MNWQEFSRWFNRDFWRAFRNRTLPIRIPKTQADKEATVKLVFEKIKSARYAPSIPEAEIIMDKGHGVARTIPVFCIEDYLVFYFCIKELEDVVSGNRTEHTFGGWTLGGTLRRLEEIDVEFDTGFSSARYAFNPRAWTAAFGEFNSLLFAQLETGSYTHVVQFDLSNFYDCIRLDILERWIREDSPAEKGWVIALLFYFLNQWNRRNTGLHPQTVGLPQDALADCSRLLANYYLQRYDKFASALCAKAGARYFRYADDQMILLNGLAQADTLMLLLTRNLDRHGLRVNQKKVEMWTARELQRTRCRDIQEIFKTKGDNQKPVLVRKFAEAYLKLTDKQISKTWNKGLPLLNRLIWANIESLPQKMQDVIITRITDPEYLLRADKDKFVRAHRLNAQRRKPINLEDRLRKLGQEKMHNAFHYEALGYAREINNRSLISFFEDRISEISSQMEENRL